MGGLVEELLAKRCLGIGRLGYDEQAAGVLVDAVHKTHLRVVGVERLEVAQMPCHSVDERPIEVAGTGMHHHAGRFVDHHHIVVLIDDVERYLFRLYA